MKWHWRRNRYTLNERPDRIQKVVGPEGRWVRNLEADQQLQLGVVLEINTWNFISVWPKAYIITLNGLLVESGNVEVLRVFILIISSDKSAPMSFRKVFIVVVVNPWRFSRSWHEVVCISARADQSGDRSSQYTNDQTARLVLHTVGIQCRPSPTL